MKYFGLLALLISNSVLASSGFNFFGEASHLTHIPAHTLALVFGAMIIVVSGVYYRYKTATVKNVVIPDKGITVRNLIESLGQMMYNTAKTVMGVS